MVLRWWNFSWGVAAPPDPPWMADNVPLCDNAPDSLTKTSKNAEMHYNGNFCVRNAPHGAFRARNASKWRCLRERAVKIVTCVKKLSTF